MIKSSGPEREEKCMFNKNKGPSDEWFMKLQSRHPELAWRVPQVIDTVRLSQTNEFVLDDFFNKYGAYYIIPK